MPDSDGGTWTDHNWLAGRLREQITYLGNTSTVVEKTLSDPYVFGPTASQTLLDLAIEARFVNTAVATKRTALDGNRGWRTTRTTNVFLADRSGRLNRVDNDGDVATTTDDQCTRFTYATNAAGTMLNSIARVETVAVNCAATPDRAVDVISDLRTLFDGASTFGSTLTRGLATRIEKLANWNGGNPVYVTTGQTVYDAHGRPVEQTDTLGRTTTTRYTPTTGGPVTRTEVTNPMSWTVVTDLDPAWEVATRVTDPNNLSTTLAYDALGRLTGVWHPGRTSPALPDRAFEYLVRSDAATVVTSKRLNPAGTAHIASYTFYDGLLRQRQVQVPAAGGGGRIITETIYDSRGLVHKQRPEYFNAAAPTPTLFVPTGDTAVPAQTVDTYDGAGRVVTQAFQVDGAPRWQTRTGYGGDNIRVEPPAGAPATTTWTDARDRIVKMWQYHGNVATGDFDETLRTYTRAGDLATVRDASGATWRYDYDQRHRRVRDEDPDKGVVTYGYDDADRLTTAADARNVTLAFAYDALDRKTATHLGSTSDRKLSSWTYDTLAKGQLTSSTRFDDAGNVYVNAVTGYSLRYQPLGTSTTIPGVEGALAGVYTGSQTYNVDGSVATQTLPAKTGSSNFGGLTAETNHLRVRPPGPAHHRLRTGHLRDADPVPPGRQVGHGRVQRGSEPERVAVLGVRARHRAARRAPGARRHRPGRRGRHVPRVRPGRQHHVHIGQSWPSTRPARTTRSASGTTTCAASPPPGPRPPGTADRTRPCPRSAVRPRTCRDYTYAPNGNRLSETERRTSGTTTRTYTYPASARPHAVSTVTTAAPGATRTDTYTYDAVGNTTKRPGSTGEQTLSWNPEGQVATVTENGVTATHVYDADGDRLIERGPAGRTLYVGGTMYRATAGGAVTGGRGYGHGLAGTVATRDAAAGLYFEASDHQGSGEYAFKATDLTMSRRRFAPFGLARGGVPTWPDPYGYVGGEHDQTGTVHRAPGSTTRSSAGSSPPIRSWTLPTRRPGRGTRTPTTPRSPEATPTGCGYAWRCAAAPTT